jgi:hypothetical protein
LAGASKIAPHGESLLAERNVFSIQFVECHNTEGILIIHWEWFVGRRWVNFRVADPDRIAQLPRTGLQAPRGTFNRHAISLHREIQ